MEENAIMANEAITRRIFISIMFSHVFPCWNADSFRCISLAQTLILLPKDLEFETAFMLRKNSHKKRFPQYSRTTQKIMNNHTHTSTASELAILAWSHLHEWFLYHLDHSPQIRKQWIPGPPEMVLQTNSLCSCSLALATEADFRSVGRKLDRDDRKASVFGVRSPL